MSQPLIEQLFTSKECEIIKTFYKEEPPTRMLLQKAIGSKLLQDTSKIITSNALDVISLICLNADFANSEDECQRVAMNVYQFYNKPKNIIPLLSVDFGLEFSNKALIALSFFPQCINERCNRFGFPSPSFYRKISKAIFQQSGQRDIAEHHEKWEEFLQKMVV